MKYSTPSDYQVVGWRAWFSEYRAFDSVRHNWEDLPPTGALVFRLYYAGGGGRMVSGADVYWRQETPRGAIHGHDTRASAVLEGVPANCIKYGSWVTDPEYVWASQEAREAHFRPFPEVEGRR